MSIAHNEESPYFEDDNYTNEITDQDEPEKESWSADTSGQRRHANTWEQEHGVITDDHIQMRIVTQEMLEDLGVDEDSLPMFSPDVRRLMDLRPECWRDDPDQGHLTDQEAHWVEKTLLEAPKWVEWVKARFAQIGITDLSLQTLEAKRASEPALNKICDLFKITVLKGELITLHNPNSQFFHGHWLDDPTPESESKWENARRYKGEAQLEFGDQEGEREFMLPGLEKDEDEVPWEDDAILDPFGQGLTDFRTVKVFSDAPKGKARDYVLTWVIYGPDGREVDRLGYTGGHDSHVAVWEASKRGPNCWAQLSKVHKATVLQKQAMDRRMVRGDYLTMKEQSCEAWERVRFEQPRWWEVLDEKKRPTIYKAVTGRGRKGFYELDWNWKEGKPKPNLPDIRKGFLEGLKHRIDQGEVTVLFEDHLPWGPQVVHVAVEIPQEWLKNEKNSHFTKPGFGEKLDPNKPKPKYFAMDVLGPPTLVRTLLAKRHQEIKDSIIALPTEEIQSNPVMTKVAVLLQRAEACCRISPTDDNPIRPALPLKVKMERLREIDAAIKEALSQAPQKTVVLTGDAPRNLSKSWANRNFFCEHCGRPISRRRIDLAASMQFEWALVNTTTGREIQRYPWERKQAAIVRGRILTWNSKQKAYQATRMKLKVVPPVYTYEVKIVWREGAMISPDNPENTLLRRCVKEIRPMKARTIKVDGKYIYLPAVKGKVVFCNGEDLINQSVC